MTRASRLFTSYFDDPDIAGEPMPLREVHAIRLAIHEGEKDMSPEERADHTNKRTDAVMNEFSLHSFNREPAHKAKKAV